MSLRKDIATLIEAGRLDEIASLAERSSSVPTILMSRLYDANAVARWRAADAMGRACAILAQRAPDKVRQVLQRLVWALNDESGTTGWGVPQAIGEIICRDSALAREFAPMLVAYLQDEDVAVGTDVLVHGVVHAIGRAAERDADIVRPAVPALQSLLADPNATTRGLAAWALGRIRAKEASPHVQALLQDAAPAELYQAGELVRTDVATLASQALAALRT